MLFFPLEQFTIIPIIEISNVSIFLYQLNLLIYNLYLYMNLIILTCVLIMTVILSIKIIMLIAEINHRPIILFSIWQKIKEWWHIRNNPNGIRRAPVREEPSDNDNNDNKKSSDDKK